MTAKYDKHYNPCEGCEKETSSCLLIQGQCPYKRTAELREIEEEAAKKRLIVINFEAIETD